MLLPSLPKGSVIVLDNASFHRSAGLRACVSAAGCELLFLPAYSPGLNLIKHVWVTLKKLLQKKLHRLKRKTTFIMKTYALSTRCFTLKYLKAASPLRASVLLLVSQSQSGYFRSVCRA